MTKLDEIQELRNYLLRAKVAYDILIERYYDNVNFINKINIFVLNRVMKNLEYRVEHEINKIRKRRDQIESRR